MMSEYPYYEFLAVDKPLSETELRQVRAFSTRAEITPHGFVNEYHWGDFKGSPETFVTKYFDVMVYYANWGTRRLFMGFAADDIDVSTWKQYESDASVEITKGKSRVLVDLLSEEEPEFECAHGESPMAALSPIWEELLSGDERPLYFAWLAGADAETDGSGPPDDSGAPAVPAGLGQLTPAQRKLAEFLRVDKRTIGRSEIAKHGAGAIRQNLSGFIADLPQAEKDRVLLDLVSGADPQAGTKLMRQFRKSQRKN